MNSSHFFHNPSHLIPVCKNKPNLTLGLAAAIHEQLQLFTEYIYCHENRHGDLMIIETKRI